MQITITVQVNENKWADEYGVETDEVRADVINYLRNALHCAEVPINVTAK